MDAQDRDDEARRRSVAEDYAAAVRRPSPRCCCSPEPKGAVARLADYTDAEIAALPDEAVANSFGCGNPLAFSAVQPGNVVLDLGSGAGIDLLLAAKKVGQAGCVIGVDMTDAMIEKAEANVSAAGLTNVNVRNGLIEDLPVDSGSVDWVIFNCVINLSPQKRLVFAEIQRVLKPGGRILISDIVAEDLPAEIAGHRRLYSSCLAGAIPEREYLDGLIDAGLVDVEVVDRLVYEPAQIEALIGTGDGEGGCCGKSGDELAKHWAPLLAGKVASVKVAARKPS